MHATNPYHCNPEGLHRFKGERDILFCYLKLDTIITALTVYLLKQDYKMLPN